MSLNRFSIAQTPEKYFFLTQGGDEAYQNKDYIKSAKLNTMAFDLLNYKGTQTDKYNSAYNAACSWALAGETDSAFVELYKIAIKGKFHDVEQISSDNDLTSLHNDKRWIRIINAIKQNKRKFISGWDKDLVKVLDTIYNNDQQYRLKADRVRDSSHSKEAIAQWQAIWKIIHEKDSTNEIKVSHILDQYGWLGPSKIGDKGNQTLFLVIQHADLQMQKKYLPMLEKAVQKGDAQPWELAYLTDRVALKEGKEQVYGSQIWTDLKTGKSLVRPLKDPDNVDRRRAKVGLEPMSMYLKQFGLTWNPKEYKAQLPTIEKEMKKFTFK